MSGAGRLNKCLLQTSQKFLYCCVEIPQTKIINFTINIMSSKGKIKCCLAIVVAFFGLSQSQLLAQPAPTEINRISPSKYDLRLEKPELFSNGQQTATVDSTQALYEPLGIQELNQANVVRPIEWQMRVRREELDNLNNLEATYEIRANNNISDDRLSRGTSKYNTIAVDVVSNEIQALPDGNESETVIVEGRATLRFDVSNFPAAGVYRGKLSICLKDRSNGCIGQ